MSLDILGINARNLLYIRPYNSKKAIRLADDKLKTKHFLAARGIPVPKLYGQIRSNIELNKFDFDSLPTSFVLKPNSGYGGEGIILIIDRDGHDFITAMGDKIPIIQIKEHIEDILQGRFAISGLSDIAFFEQRVIPHEAIGKYSFTGLPDIRIVVYNLIPVMAMLRLPTKRSKGKANLHQGALGVGIDIARGEATYIARGSKMIHEVPDIGSLRNLKIPYWDNLLLIASKVQLVTNLGYLAVDLVIDKDSGPLLLEINARAGLSLQIANLAPLRQRLERIQGLKVITPEKGVRLAKDMFGNQLERNIKHLSGKEVIGGEEMIEIIQPTGTHKVLARIDTGSEATLIDRDFAQKIELPFEHGKKKYKLKYVLRNVRIQTAVEIKDFSYNDEYKIRLGRRDLPGFLIDPIKKISSTKFPIISLGHDKKTPHFSEIDRIIVSVDKQIKTLYYLRPLNFVYELEKFKDNFLYNPQFLYRPLNFSPSDLLEKLKRIELFELNDSALGQIYRRKIEEIRKKISLLENRGKEKFQNYSEDLFGFPQKLDIEIALKEGRDYLTKTILTEQKFSAEHAALRFEHIFKLYGLSYWKVKLKDHLVGNVVAGKDNVLFLNKHAQFSEKRLASLIVHEIETHIFTAENGKRQPYSIFNRGTAYYLQTQEGLAIYNQEMQTQQKSSSPISVLAIYKAASSSFTDVYSYLIDFGVSQERALNIALKVKRGLSDTSKPGAFTKDWIYFKGNKEIKEFIQGGGELKRLYIGKIALDDLEIIEQVPGLMDPIYLPSFI